jgi:hypothetical protein
MEQRPDGGWSKMSPSPPHHGIYRHEHFAIKSQEACSLDGACISMAEEYFLRLRRAEIGIHHHIAGSYLLRYAQESSWREENRRVPNGDQVNPIIADGRGVIGARLFRTSTLKHTPRAAPRGPTSTNMSWKTMPTTRSQPSKRSEKQSTGRKVRGTLPLSPVSGT